MSNPTRTTVESDPDGRYEIDEFEEVIYDKETGKWYSLEGKDLGYDDPHLH